MSSADNKSSAAAHSMVVPPPGTVQFARTFENERYYPIVGWSARLLPTDRYPWSNENGTIAIERDGLSHPPHCTWCGDWEAVVEPAATDAEGWQYAGDFPSNKYANKNFLTACVRRRQWRRPFRSVTDGERDAILRAGGKTVAAVVDNRAAGDDPNAWTVVNDNATTCPAAPIVPAPRHDRDDIISGAFGAAVPASRPGGVAASSPAAQPPGKRTFVPTQTATPAQSPALSAAAATASSKISDAPPAPAPPAQSAPPAAEPQHKPDPMFAPASNAVLLTSTRPFGLHDDEPDTFAEQAARLSAAMPSNSTRTAAELFGPANAGDSKKPTHDEVEDLLAKFM